MSRSVINLALFAAIGVTVLATGYFWGSRGAPRPARTVKGEHAAGSRDTSLRNAVAALGRLAPKGGVVDVGGMTGERIEHLAVAEGEAVEAGRELAFLSSYPLRQSELQLAEIQLKENQARHDADVAYGDAIVAEAVAMVEQLKLVDRDLEALRAKIAALELNQTIAIRDFERMESAGSEVISDQELDHQRLVVEQSKAELHSAQAQLAKVESSREANQREAQAKLETAKASQLRLRNTIQLESLEQGKQAAAQKLEMAVIRAPIEGRVLKILTHAGESIGQRPILQLGDTGHMYAVAEIYETDIRHVHPGQRATITSDALLEPLTGTVEKLGMTVSKNQVDSLNPTASADARVVSAWIRLDDSQPVAGLVDLQVDVVIDTRDAATAERTLSNGQGG